MASKDYVKIARQYAADVMSGKIPACKWVKLAVDRQLADLKTYAGSRSLYRQLPAFFYSLPKSSLKTATIA